MDSPLRLLLRSPLADLIIPLPFSALRPADAGSGDELPENALTLGDDPLTLGDDQLTLGT